MLIEYCGYICQVSGALTDEIRRLAILVDEFDRPFHSDSNLLRVYKKVSESILVAMETWF